MDDEDFGELEEFEIYPEPLSKWVFIRAGLEFASHVVGGVQCALAIVGQSVVQAEVFSAEKKSFEESVRADMEMLPETE